MVSPLISIQTTNFRKAIPAGERLSLTLRYLASGESQISLSFGYRIGKSTVSQIISETCKAIYKVLSPVYFRTPVSAEEWLNIAKSVEDQWNLPRVVGAIDGKHIQAPFSVTTKGNVVWCFLLFVTPISAVPLLIVGSMVAVTTVEC